jgi:hypothetical protein
MLYTYVVASEKNNENVFGQHLRKFSMNTMNYFVTMKHGWVIFMSCCHITDVAVQTNNFFYDDMMSS